MPIVLVLGIGMGFSINVSGEEALIPSWIKNTAGFWVDDQVSDVEFLNAIEFLVNQGIISVSDEHGESNEYYTYVDDNDKFQIKFPKNWVVNNENGFVVANPETLDSPFPEYIAVQIIPNDSPSGLDVYDFVLKQELEETVTDLKIIKEEWINPYTWPNFYLEGDHDAFYEVHKNDPLRVEYFGYKISYQEQKGTHTLINTRYYTMDFEPPDRTRYYIGYYSNTYLISHVADKNTSSIDLDEIFKSFKIGKSRDSYSGNVYSGVIFD